MASYTITYNDKVQGFPSFFSYSPEQIQGMNNRMYTFKGGDMYVHNPNNSPNNNFYDTQYNSTVSTIMNEDILDNKIFKTINLEGTHPWDITLTSDLQSTGYINADWLSKTENSYRGFVRNTGGDPTVPEELPLRSMEGLGISSSVTSLLAASTAYFPMDISLDNVSAGDAVYAAVGPAYDTLFLVGLVTFTSFLPTAGVPVNNMTIDTTTGVSIGTTDHYFMISKSALAESHGITGHYGAITLTQDSTEDVELFVVEAEVMSSKT